MPDIYEAKPYKINVKKNVEKKPSRGLLGADNKKLDKSGARKHKSKSVPLGHTRNPFASFSYYPKHASFVSQDPQEKVVLLLRRHPITNTRWLAISFAMLIFPVFVSALSIVEYVPLRFRFILAIFWFLITFAFMFEEFLRWFFHVNIITDERIIEVDFHNLIYREITDANIADIQDVTVELGGALRTFFNIGNLLIQTAAEVPKIDFEDVPRPDRVAKILRKLRVEEEVEKLEGRVR
jgi:membrane protein YdbS with pleckstrin-like domain